MFTNLQFFLCLSGVFLIFLRFQFKFCTLSSIYIEYLLCARYQTRTQAILSMKLLSSRSPIVSYLSSPVDIFKPLLSLTSQLSWLPHSFKNNILPLVSTTLLSSSSQTSLRHLSLPPLRSSWSSPQPLLFFPTWSLWEISPTTVDSTITWAACFYLPPSVPPEFHFIHQTDLLGCPTESQTYHSLIISTYSKSVFAYYVLSTVKSYPRAKAELSSLTLATSPLSSRPHLSPELSISLFVYSSSYTCNIANISMLVHL